MGELGEISTGSTPSTANSAYYSDDGMPWVTPTDINALTISDTPRKLSEEGAKVGRVVPANTILCTCIASIGKNTLLTAKGSFNQQINSLTPYDENDAYFLLTESEIWSNTMKRMAASGTMQIVNKAEFSELKTKVPSLAEQQQIGTYFKNLDNLITLHQRKYDKLQNIKKSMLEKMFPKNGSNVPEIRFSGFTDPWEQRKLSEIADRFDNLRVPVAANLRVSGDTPYYGANGIQDYVEGYTHDGEYVLVAEDGASDLKNYPVNYVNGRIWVNNHAHVLQGKNNIASNRFLSYAINMANIESVLVGGGRAKLNADVMMNLGIVLPTYKEQCRVAEYFSYLDNLITLHQRELEKLQNIKKSMLEKMFV